MAAIVGKYEDVDQLLMQFESLRSARTDFDSKWQMVSDYILPRRDFSVTKRPNELRPHKVVSSVATNANARMAALLLTYWIDPTRPFLQPNVRRGLVSAGRSTDLSPPSLDYLGNMSWGMYSHMVLPRAKLLMQINRMLREYCSFGCGVIWTGRKRGFGPYYQAKPIQACWWSENEEGDIDTLYFRILLPLYRVFQRWPESAALWKVDADKAPSELELTPILMCCKPRPGGLAGAVRANKPFAYIALAEDKKTILERSGYDSFPYAVFRYDAAPGDAYAEGPGCQVLPDVMVLNHLTEAIENAASQKASPPLAIPARMFSKMLDRRPGAANLYNAAGMGLARADQAIIKLDFTGDITEAKDLKRALTDDIEIGYFTDWLRMRESGDMTAEEVNARTDLRLRGMASIVANGEQPMTVLGDRTLEILAEEALIAPPPNELGGIDVDWEYAGPLAIAQLRGNVQAALQLVNAAGLVHEQDPNAADAVDLEETLRVIGEGLGTPPATLRTRVQAAQRSAARQQAQQQQQQAENLKNVAGAAADGAGAVSDLADAGATVAGATPGGGAAFAPASPFQPIAA